MRVADLHERLSERKAGLFRVLVLASAAAATVQAAGNYDLWWQLASGRLMVAEKRLLDADPFSFTRPGFRWLNHEWLFQLFEYLGFQVAGEWFPALMTLLLGAVTYYFLFGVALRRSSSEASVGLLLALSLAGARFRFDPRPEMASYCFLAALCYLLQTSLEPGKRRRAWLLFPLFAIWSNVHPAVLLGGAVAVLWLVGEAIERHLRPASALPDHRRGAVILSSLGAILLNPGGWRLLAVPLELHRIVGSGHAPNLEWAPPQFADFPLFYFSAGIALLFLVGSWLEASLRGRHSMAQGDGTVSRAVSRSWISGAPSLDWPAALAAGLAGMLAFQQLRNIGFFFLLLPLALARPMADVVQRSRLPAAAWKVLGGTVLALLMAIFLGGAREWVGENYLRKLSPSGAVRFLERNSVGRHLFNDVKFGGYLIWERFPERRVFIDGRNEIYDSLLEEVFQALGSWERWESLLRRYEIDAAMLRRGQVQAVQYPPEAPGERPRQEMRAFSAAYFQSSRWALVYWDDEALIFVRRDDSRYQTLLEREFKVVNPDDAPHLLSQIRKGQASLSEAMAEVDRKLDEDPRCSTARRLRDELASLTRPAAR